MPEEEEKDENERRLAFNALADLGKDQFPHCDALVLHAPKTCVYCDDRAEWQALRIIWGINFTGEEDPNKKPCPSTLRRPVEVIHKWPGNAPNAPPPPPRTIYERIRENPLDDEEGKPSG